MSKRAKTQPSDAAQGQATDPAPLPATTEWISLGKITAPFGLKGQVKLSSTTDFPERIGEHQTLYLGPDHRPTRLLAAQIHGNAVLLHFAEIADMTAATGLRGLEVMIPLAAAAPLAADQYYIHDLIGLRAIHRNGTPLGTIADVLTNGGQDLLVVRRPAVPDVLVPLVKAIVPSIDIAAGVVTIDPPGGLFDDDFILAEDG